MDLADTFLQQQHAYTQETRQNHQILLKSLSLQAELQRDPRDGRAREVTEEEERRIVDATAALVAPLVE